MNDTQDIRNKLEQLKGQKLQVQRTMELLDTEVHAKNVSLRKHEKAKEIIRIVGLKTQNQISYHISDITSLALEAVFPDPYELAVEFIQRRNKTECDLFFVRDGEKFDPMTASGVGAVDVAAFALRIASWSMSIPHTRPTIILDEPFRFLSANYQEQASIMLKELSKKLRIQFIIVTHEQVLTSYADKVFEVKIRRKKSKLTVI
jgi:hypothetical protein